MTQGAGVELIGRRSSPNFMATPGVKKGFKQSEKQKAKAREVMLRLRRERPDRFTSDARRRKPKPPAPIQPEKPTPQPTPPPPQPTPAPVTTPAAPDRPAFMTVQPDTELFGTENVPPPKMDQTPPPPGSLPPGGQPGGTPPPGPDQQPSGQHTTVLPKDTRALAVMVWTMILSLLAVIFGPAMYPRKVGNGPNEVPYDENEMVIGAWMDYFASIGLKPLSPVLNLWLSILAYLLPRAEFVVITVKRWFNPKARGTQNARKPESDETPAPEKPLEKTESPSDTPAPAPPEQGQVKLATREEGEAALDELG
jgi:hypothetical protein